MKELTRYVINLVINGTISIIKMKYNPPDIYLIQFEVLDKSRLLKEIISSKCNEMSEFMGCYIETCDKCRFRNFPCDEMMVSDSQIIFIGSVNNVYAKILNLPRSMSTGRSVYSKLIYKKNIYEAINVCDDHAKVQYTENRK